MELQRRASSAPADSQEAGSGDSSSGSGGLTSLRYSGALRDSLIASYLDGREGETASPISARAWIENFEWRCESTIREEVRRVADKTWLVLLSELPDPDDDPDVVEREADEELERRRMSFRRY